MAFTGDIIYTTETETINDIIDDQQYIDIDQDIIEKDTTIITDDFGNIISDTTITDYDLSEDPIVEIISTSESYR